MPPKRKKPMKKERTKKRRVKACDTEAVLSSIVKQEPGTSPSKELVEKVNNQIKRTRILLEKQRLRLSCNECNKQFRFKNSFLLHKKREHSKLPGSVQCNKCPVCCPDSATLKEHIRNVHEREIFECDVCEKKFVRYAHVLRHKAQSGCDGKKVNLYPCEICFSSFSRKDNLMVHLRQQHILGKKYHCKQCEFQTGTFSKLLIHSWRHSDNPPHYECDICGKVTSSRAAICKHLEIHGEKKFGCDVCGYKTYTLEVMRRHVLTHVDDKPHKCDACGQTFIQRSQLQRHAEKHLLKNCDVCGEFFPNKAQLLKHSKSHVKDKTKRTCPFKDCEESEKVFMSEADLERHITNHINKKPDSRPYTCEVCNKTYRKELDMRRHVASHTLERPRRCMYCVAARAYVRGEQLVKHVRKAHPAVFREHLMHVRQVLGVTSIMDRVKKSELESILQVLDAESERILQGYGEGVLYGGMQETDDSLVVEVPPAAKNEASPLMSEEDLAQNMNKLLVQLIDKDLLECFGWPHESVDTVLEKVIEHCGAKPADREKWTRVQRLRENAKHLFLYVIEDKNIARMLYSHTIDQIVSHILTQVADNKANDEADHETAADETIDDETIDDETIDDETMDDETIDDEDVRYEVVDDETVNDEPHDHKTAVKIITKNE